MGAGLTKNKLSPEPKRTPRQGVTLVAPPSSSSTPKSNHNHNHNHNHHHDRPDQAPEDEFFEKIANNYMKRDRKSFHTGGTTYAGVDLRLEIDSVDTPAMEEPSDTSYEEEEDVHSETSEYAEDDGYYTTAEKVLYEKPKPKPDNTQFIVSWKKGTLLGSGGFGKVYLGLDNETGAMFAVKEISLGGDAYQQSKELKSFKQEVAVMKNLRHENIVQYLGTQEDGNELHIFLEYVPGGSIAFILSKFGSFSEPLVKRYTRQILLGLEYLHSHHIIHRDIKGANILVDNCGVVKLADFGASKKMEALMTTTGGYQSLKGTPYWMAPEVIRQSGYGRQADIWSVGCTVIEMATGKPPFHEFTDQVSVLFHIASSNSPPPIPSHLSPIAQDFLLKCFERNPMNRPNARGLLDHPFLKEDGRKLSGNSSGFSSPKTSHSNFNSPRNKDAPPVQFAKEERQPSPHIQPAQRPTLISPIQQPPPPPLQADADNMMEEPTWTWGGDKKKLNFVDKFSNDLANNYVNHNSKRDSLSSPSSRLPDPDSPMEIRRHKRAISVTPEKMIPSTPTPQDTNTPPPARLSMRRHSALESSLREASEFFKLKDPGNLPANPSQHSNGLCSSPSTPGRTRPQPDSDSPFNNINMANFNNTFNQSFNSINNTNINITQYGNNMSLKTSNGTVPAIPMSAVSNNNNISSPGPGKRYSPGTPRREVVDEEDINKFLKTTSNELMASTKDLSKFTEKRPNPKPVDKLPDITEHRRKPSQISPKKFSDGMMDISEEASDAKFKKKAPGTTTTTIVLNTSAINQHNVLRTSSSGISSPNGSSGNLVITNGKDSLREKDRDRESYRDSYRESYRDRDRGDGVSVNKSGGIVRNAW